MATIEEVYQLVKSLKTQISKLEKKVALQGTEISKLTAQLRIEQSRGEQL
jgi:uncharacterized coiled-coil protein SlyX